MAFNLGLFIYENRALLFILGIFVVGAIIVLKSNNKPRNTYNKQAFEHYMAKEKAKEWKKEHSKKNDVKLNKNLSRYDDDFFNR